MKTSPAKILLRGLLAAAICLPSLAAHAVTDEEMDHACAIAAQVYLRYTNDKAEYLDNKKAQSVKELRSMVEGHKTDVENLKQFLAAPVSKDYSSWGKEQLAAYWSKTFFQNAGLSNKAEQSRNNTIKARIGTMTVTEPSAQNPQPEEQQTQAATPAEQPAAQEAPAQAVDTSAAETSEEEEVAQADQGSNTWLYVVLLIVLIGIVIWLVLYAMRAMKGPEQKQDSPEKRKKAEPSEQQEKYAPQPVPAYEVAVSDTEIDEMQARYANTIAAKNDEIERLRRALDNSRAAEQEARSRADQLTARVGQLQQQLQSLHDKPATRPQPAPGGERVIYLGRANRNRVFVRADRQVTPGKTVYRLVTTNNLTGTFTVETDPSVVALVSLDAHTALYGACEAPTLAGAESCSRIVTDTAGTAIFEDNCWKVLHPAAVHLE